MILISILVVKQISNKFITIPNYQNFPLYPKRISNFLNDNEINMLLNECKSYQDSTTVSNGKLVVNNFRTSKTCFIDNNSKINNIIKKKIKDKFNIEQNIERLQITHYDPDQYYKPHHDYFYENDLEGKKQRLKTIFVYLKCPDKGGETTFPMLKKKFVPKKGDALAWTNCTKKDNKYIYNDWSIHEGSIVLDGEKIGLNIWIIDN